MDRVSLSLARQHTLWRGARPVGLHSSTDGMPPLPSDRAKGRELMTGTEARDLRPWAEVGAGAGTRDREKRSQESERVACVRSLTVTLLHKLTAGR